MLEPFILCKQPASRTKSLRAVQGSGRPEPSSVEHCHWCKWQAGRSARWPTLSPTKQSEDGVSERARRWNATP